MTMNCIFALLDNHTVESAMRPDFGRWAASLLILLFNFPASKLVLVSETRPLGAEKD